MVSQIDDKSIAIVSNGREVNVRPAYLKVLGTQGIRHSFGQSADNTDCKVIEIKTISSIATK